MSRKRRIFDIDMPAVEDIPVGKVPQTALAGARRGPMATAISENAESLKERAVAEQAIREENDKLAHELVRLRREGLVVESVPLDEIHSELLVRDRSGTVDPELEELTLSIREIGLSNPIRVQARADGGYELIQGMRRLSAFRVLFEHTGEAAYAHIPAAIMPEAAPLEDSYRRMVDENLVRKNISFAEMGQLARAYAEDPENDCPDVDKAVAILFKSASYTKRSYIRAFAALVARLDKALAHPEAIPRNLGVNLKRRLDDAPELSREIVSALLAEPDRDAARELAILRSFVEKQAAETLPAGKVAKSGAGERPIRKPRATFTLAHGRSAVKCTASAGRFEMRCDVDFSTVDRRDLERALVAFLDTLEGDG